MKLHPRLTAEGVVLARRAERFRPVAEQDGRGWVVGYGHRAGAREGATVSEADATALLAYDLSQSAGRVEPLLREPVSPALFDALNAHAFRFGLEAFGRSDALRRVNAGEAVAPADVVAGSETPQDAPPSAVTVAAQAVRERVSQVLADPEPLPPRPPREPWPETLAPAPTPAPPAPAAAPTPASEPSEATPADPGEARDPQPHAPTPRDESETPTELSAPLALPPVDPTPGGDEAQGDELDLREEEEPAPPPFVAAAAPWPPRADARESSPPGVEPDPPGPAQASASSAPWRASPPVPLVSFVGGGRPRPWDRVRANPYVYMAVGACGLVLFASALLGFLLGRPTGPGLALGVVGVICIAPALAFFLHRRRGGGAGG